MTPEDPGGHSPLRVPRPLTVGTAGHIDHGKTALVRALTGRDTDRLAEEQRRGMSIELGFAALEAGGRQLSLVDVPGHERFLRTMIAGASGIDLFLLAVAADDGPMPQTREHLTVLRALGVEPGVLAVTKVDLVDAARRREVIAECGGPLPEVRVVEVSTRSGEGVEGVRSALAAVAAEVDARADAADARGDGAPVLHVDRVFTVAGYGTVVTGTLWSGRLERGQRVRVLPDGREARVRSLEVHDRAVEVAEPRQRVAVNLGGVGRDEVARGDVVTVAGSGVEATYRLDVELGEGAAAIAAERRVQVHLGTREAPARVVDLDTRDRSSRAVDLGDGAADGRVVDLDTREAAGRAVGTGEARGHVGDGAVQLRLEAPLLARAGDRLVVRRIAPPDTLGGGVVRDPSPPRHGPGWSPPDAEVAERPAMRVKRQPRRRAGSNASARPAPEVEPTPEPSALARRLLAELEAGGERPPGAGELAERVGLERREVDAALGELVDAGVAVRLKADLLYPAPAYAALRDRIVALANENGATSIAEVRDALGLSRKYAQALLETMDRERLLRRDGDRHLPRPGTRGAG